MSIENIRKDYQKHALNESDCPSNPINLMQAWLSEAVTHSEDGNAMVVSSVSADGMPSSRVVLIRKVEERGLSFFTNYQSQKGREFAQNNKVAVNFFWPWAERQVRVQGIIEKLSAEESQAYFDSRPRESQIGAWASAQSEVLTNRAHLEQQVLALTEKFKDTAIPKPDHWGGYLIKPIYFEFWQGRPSRLHDRIAYKRDAHGPWLMSRLNP